MATALKIPSGTATQRAAYVAANSGSGSNTASNGYPALTPAQMATRASHIVDSSGTSSAERATSAKKGVATPVVPNTPVDTSQPSPEGTPVGTGLPGSPTSGLAPGVTKNPDGTINYAGSAGTATLDTKTGQSKFVKAAQPFLGTQAPGSPGEAKSTVDTALGQANTDGQYKDAQSQIEQSPEWQKYITDVQESRKQQSETSVDFIKTAMKEFNIQGINHELLDINKIIDGTEEDIRKEVQAAGGFATDSQVLALANGRNKSLIAKQKYLEEEKAQSMQMVSMLSNAYVSDRAFAQQAMNQKLQIDEQMVAHKDKIISAAQETFKTSLTLMGADGVYNALLATGDPQAIALAERNYRLPPGGLAMAAQQATKARALADTKAGLENKALQANIRQSNAATAKSLADMNAPNTSGTISGKPQTGSQSAANLYGNRLNEANVVIDTLGNKFTGKGALGGSLPNFMQSGDRQAYEQAKKNFVTAVLRRESGAAISPTEFTTADSQYFPQAGDKSTVLAQKETLRNTVINSFYKEADVLRPLLPGMVFQKGDKKYKVIGGDMSDPDVEEIK